MTTPSVTSTSLLVAVVMFALPICSRADWEYTRWGMTPEEAVAASAGKLKALPDNEDALRTDGRRKLAEGEHRLIRNFKVQWVTVSLIFDKGKEGGLASVFLGVPEFDVGIATFTLAADCDRLREHVESQFGKGTVYDVFGNYPEKISARETTWITPQDIDVYILNERNLLDPTRPPQALGLGLQRVYYKRTCALEIRPYDSGESGK